MTPSECSLPPHSSRQPDAWRSWNGQRSLPHLPPPHPSPATARTEHGCPPFLLGWVGGWREKWGHGGAAESKGPPPPKLGDGRLPCLFMFSAGPPHIPRSSERHPWPFSPLHFDPHNRSVRRSNPPLTLPTSTLVRLKRKKSRLQACSETPHPLSCSREICSFALENSMGTFQRGAKKWTSALLLGLVRWTS